MNEHAHGDANDGLNDGSSHGDVDALPACDGTQLGDVCAPHDDALPPYDVYGYSCYVPLVIEARSARIQRNSTWPSGNISGSLTIW